MSVNKIRKQLQTHENELKEYGVYKIAIFGSFVRNEERPDSDVDILVDFDPKKGLFGFIELKCYLETLLGKQIDLVTRNALHPALREQILREAKHAF